MLDDDRTSSPEPSAPALSLPRSLLSEKDRRRYGRRAILGSAQAWTPNAVVEADGVGRHPVVVRNVSLEGVRFEAIIALDVSTEFVLHVRVDGRDLSIPCETLHVWNSGCTVGERLFAHGCRFLFISPRDAQALAGAGHVG